MPEYISRESAIDAVYERCSGEHWEDILRSLPAADVAPVRHGSWIFREVLDNGHRTFLSDRWYCSACGEYQTHGETLYCPHCGARMLEEAETDE